MRINSTPSIIWMCGVMLYALLASGAFAEDQPQNGIDTTVYSESEWSEYVNGLSMKIVVPKQVGYGDTIPVQMIFRVCQRALYSRYSQLRRFVPNTRCRFTLFDENDDAIFETLIPNPLEDYEGDSGSKLSIPLNVRRMQLLPATSVPGVLKSQEFAPQTDPNDCTESLVDSAYKPNLFRVLELQPFYLRVDTWKKKKIGLPIYGPMLYDPNRTDTHKYVLRAVDGGTYTARLEFEVLWEDCETGWTGQIVSEPIEIEIGQEHFETELVPMELCKRAIIKPLSTSRVKYVDPDTIWLEKRKGFKLYYGIAPDSSTNGFRPCCSGLYSHLLHSFSIVKNYEEQGLRKLSFYMEVFESSEGMGYHAQIFGYGVRKLWSGTVEIDVEVRLDEE